MSKKPLCIFPWLLFTLVFSCTTAEEKLQPVKSTSAYRMEDIEHQTAEDPVKAIHLITVYRALYGEESRHSGNFTPETEEHLKQLESMAIENLKTAQILAIEEKRWDDAASMARSLAALGIKVSNTGMEPDILLAEAKASLETGDNAAYRGVFSSGNYSNRKDRSQRITGIRPGHRPGKRHG